MDALRYAVMKIELAMTRPVKRTMVANQPGDTTAGY